MKARSIVLTIAIATLTFILGGFLVYQVVAPKENKEEEKTPSNSECEICKECQEGKEIEINDTTIKIDVAGNNPYISHINGKEVNFPEKDDLDNEEYGTYETRIFNNYVINWYARMDSSSFAIYDKNAKVVYNDDVFLYSEYLEYTNSGMSIGETKKDVNGDFYWELTTIDLSGKEIDVKTTKEKINVDCKIYGGEKYETLSEKDKIKYYPCCTGCK